MTIRTPCVALVFFFLCLPFFVHSETKNINDTKVIKGMFVFGSSLVDNGNNFFLNGTKARADYAPYGIDFQNGVTGRFTNGKNVIDLLGEQLKFPSFIPPFLNPSTKRPKIVNGIDFASGGSGILDDTGNTVVGPVISLNQQIRNFETILPELEAQLGKKRGEFLTNYLFVVGSGGNDYTLNYFLSRAKTSISLEDFTANLIVSLSDQLKKLYGMGGRKFVITSVYPIGCNPAVINAVKGRNRCITFVNKAATLFNSKLRNLIDVLKQQMPGSDLIYIDCYKILSDIIEAPYSKGFKETKKTCCEVPSKLHGGDGGSCKRGGTVCEDRNSYVFFDGIHPTQAVNIQIANKAFSSDNPAEVYPFNISRDFLQGDMRPRPVNTTTGIILPYPLVYKRRNSKKHN